MITKSTAHLRRILLPLLFLLFLNLFANAQQSLTVSGTVSSETNTPLSGVTVTSKGKSAITDNSGRFSIPVTKGAQIAFSYLAYENKKLIVYNTKIDVQFSKRQ